MTETSRCSITIYPMAGTAPLSFTTARTRQSLQGVPRVVECRTGKKLGEPCGQFSFSVKPGTRSFVDALNEIQDDDWVSISFSRWGQDNLVMTGQIDRIFRPESAGGGGATELTWQFVGRDHGRIFSMTPVWYEPTQGDFVAAGVHRVFENNLAWAADPATTVEAILAGFLRDLAVGGGPGLAGNAGVVGRSVWPMPQSMKFAGLGAPAGGQLNFCDVVTFYDQDFLNWPMRFNPIQPGMWGGFDGYVWPLAAEWADLPVQELYTELLIAVGNAQPRSDLRGFKNFVACRYPQPDDVLTPENCVLGVVYRDRPFPTFTRKTAGTGEQHEALVDGPWSRLPEWRVGRHKLSSLVLSRGGDERLNAFYASSRLESALLSDWFQLSTPLWDVEDMRVHGMRRYDVRFGYVGPDMYGLAGNYKQRLRDWHCLNNRMWAGTATYTRGEPSIRVGGKLRVLGAGSGNPDVVFYIEGVEHVWSLLPGLSTTVTLTRGWPGGDAALYAALDETVRRYVGVTGTGEVLSDVEAQVQPVPQAGHMLGAGKVVGNQSMIGVGESGNPFAFPIPRYTSNGYSWFDPAGASQRSPGAVPAEYDFPPFTNKLKELFESVVGIVGVPAAWADPATVEGQALHQLVKLESGGFIGRPTMGAPAVLGGELVAVGSAFGPNSGSTANFEQWPVIWKAMQDGTFAVQGTGTTSTAIGLGQLTLTNIDSGQFYTNKRFDIGVPVGEAAGMLRYIKSKNNYGNAPSGALQHHISHKWY